MCGDGGALCGGGGGWVVFLERKVMVFDGEGERLREKVEVRVLWCLYELLGFRF